MKFLHSILPSKMKSIYTFLNKKKKLKKEDVWYVVQELIKGNSSISLVDKEKIDKIGYISGVRKKG